ncbi:hypothetical protein MXD59_23055 [Frankia sp. Ag45/Mut15]|uniref:Uncharacterized protein n=1 Tax=Frankia umida TaxID=573489 RepID=A0ABT0K480_9ACTN|nr:hypothetical protein [Frankia umida]
MLWVKSFDVTTFLRADANYPRASGTFMAGGVWVPAMVVSVAGIVRFAVAGFLEVIVPARYEPNPAGGRTGR